MPEKIVSDPTQDKTLKPKKEKPVRAAGPLHAKDEGVAKAKGKPEKVRTEKINKYGFLHIDKSLAKHLGVSFGKDKEDVPVTIETIENGFVVKIVKA
jgi:hypothetical protein